ncbi:uncharacterized protein LOC124429158 isoform X2 [Vespa crabro]|uniref:uncharacterized protein LOC124429158 isoform X2 n=1 Tax=Vespa crabro TaxID=7445 RepID=UPI001F01C6D5|nr:uncharacterized protein LOC124429158 isoform X2 [Vespa crabro]
MDMDITMTVDIMMVIIMDIIMGITMGTKMDIMVDITVVMIQCRSIILDEMPKNDSDKSKRIERSFDDEMTDRMEQLDWKNEPESTTNVFWLPSPFIYPPWLQSSNQSFWQLPEKYLKRSENSDSTLMEQKNNKETWNNDKLYIEEGAKMIKTCAEQIDEMLLLIQNALGQFRKYLNEWCRNHHSMVKLSPESFDTFYLPKH